MSSEAGRTFVSTPSPALIDAVASERVAPDASHCDRRRQVARSRSPRRNVVSTPSDARWSITVKVSPRTPQPSGPSIPARVYTSVSRSAETGTPYMWSSSPTLPTTVTCSAASRVRSDRAVARSTNSAGEQNGERIGICRLRALNGLVHVISGGCTPHFSRGRDPRAQRYRSSIHH